MPTRRSILKYAAAALLAAKLGALREALARGERLAHETETGRQGHSGGNP